MAQAERQSEQKKDSKRAAARERRQGARRGGGKMQLDQLHWALLAALTAVLMEHDGALRIGFTRDGGALALGVYLGDDYATEYVRPSEDFFTAIAEIAAAWVEGGDLRLQELYGEQGWQLESR